MTIWLVLLMEWVKTRRGERLVIREIIGAGITEEIAKGMTKEWKKTHTPPEKMECTIRGLPVTTELTDRILFKLRSW